MEVEEQDNFAAMRQKRIDQMAKMHHKISSPKLRELLKEKCRIRMKESRHNLVDNRRAMFANEERRTFMSQILKEEIVEFEKDIERQEQIYKEMMEEADQWLYEEMEMLEESIIDRLVDQDSEICCPVCQKYPLMAITEAIFTCPCGVKFAFSPGIQILHGNIQRVVNDHEQVCSTRLQFFAEPSAGHISDSNDFSSLNAFCAACEFYSVIIA